MWTFGYTSTHILVPPPDVFVLLTGSSASWKLMKLVAQIYRIYLRPILRIYTCMEDLFSDLSSVSDCDEECLLNVATKKCKSFFIRVTRPQVVMEIPPAFEPEVEDRRKQTTLEEKNCETDTIGDQTFDKWVQTDLIGMQSIASLADLPPTNREATYSESALERVLRHMSAHIHRVELQQWLAEQPLRNASFHIRPVHTKAIHRAVWNSEKNIFVLLLHVIAEDRYVIELRSLKNLLKSVNRKIRNQSFQPNEKVRLFSSHHFVAIYSLSKILLMDINDLENVMVYDGVHGIVSLVVLNGSLCSMSSNGVVTKLQNDEKVLDCSPLLHPILSGFVIDNRIHVVSKKCISSFSADSPLNYESYEMNKALAKDTGPAVFRQILTGGEIRKFGKTRLMIFDKASQICSIWEADKPIRPSHELIFSSTEYTVDMSCDENNLYSLTAAGVVSVWKLRPNGRKYRDQLFQTYLNHCTKLLLTHPQKFVILTTSEVHFVVFGADAESGGQQ